MGGRMKTVEEIYDMAFDNYISPSKYDAMTKWNFKKFPFGGGNANIVKEKIQNLIIQGCIVKCGYMCSSMQGYHEYYIIFKKQQNDKAKIKDSRNSDP